MDKDWWYDFQKGLDIYLAFILTFANFILFNMIKINR